MGINEFQCQPGSIKAHFLCSKTPCIVGFNASLVRLKREGLPADRLRPLFQCQPGSIKALEGAGMGVTTIVKGFNASLVRLKQETRHPPSQ